MKLDCHHAKVSGRPAHDHVLCFQFPFGLKKTVVSWLSRVTCISPWDFPFLLIVVDVAALFPVHLSLLYTCF